MTFIYKKQLFFFTILLAITLGSAEVISADAAIEGYDPVAYFTKQKAVKGTDKFSHQWNGDTWYFSSSEHRKLFVKNPEKYAPQFNGFCANGLSDGHVVEGDPENWRIIEGKLYLFFSTYGRNQWSGEVRSLIQSAKETLGEHP